MNQLQSAALTLAGVTALFLLAVFVVWRMRRAPAETVPPVPRSPKPPRERRLPALPRRTHAVEPEVEITPARLARIRGETSPVPDPEPAETPEPGESCESAPADGLLPAGPVDPQPTLEAALEAEARAVEDRAVEDRSGLDDGAHRADSVQVRLVPQIPPRDAILTRSRLGGRPRLPADMDWPRIDGAPGDFLAQIACADLPPLLWEGLGPRTGSLAVFAHPETGAGRVLHLAEEGPPRPIPHDAGNALFGPHGGLRFCDLATLAVRAFPEWPVDIVAAEPGDDTPVVSGDPTGDDAEYDIADPAFHPFDWDSMRMLAAVLERRLMRLQAAATAPGDANDEHVAALADAAEANRDTAAGAAEIIAIIRESAVDGHDFTASDATAVMAALHALRWAHVACVADPETGEDRIETLTLPMTRHDPRAPLWVHEYRALLFDHAKHAFAASPDRLSGPARAWLEPLWQDMAAREVATIGGAPSRSLSSFDPELEAVLIELPTSGLMSRLVGEGGSMVLTIRKADLAVGDFSGVATRRA